MRLHEISAARVFDRVGAQLATDATLLGLVGSPLAIRKAQDTLDLVVPSLTYLAIADTVTETEVPLLMQFDVFARGTAEAMLIRERALALLHSDYLRDSFQGLGLYTVYAGGRQHPDPDVDVDHWSFDIEFRPFRNYTS